RRHTRSTRDWSSDVCSSDLLVRDGNFLPTAAGDRTTGQLFVAYQALYQAQPRILFTKSADAGTTWTASVAISDNPSTAAVFNPRSEERRVGKECRTRMGRAQ